MTITLHVDPCPTCDGEELVNLGRFGPTFMPCPDCDGLGYEIPEWVKVPKIKVYPEHAEGGMVALDTVPGWDIRISVLNPAWQPGATIIYQADCLVESRIETADAWSLVTVATRTIDKLVPVVDDWVQGGPGDFILLGTEGTTLVTNGGRRSRIIALPIDCVPGDVLAHLKEGRTAAQPCPTCEGKTIPGLFPWKPCPDCIGGKGHQIIHPNDIPARSTDGSVTRINGWNEGWNACRDRIFGGNDE